MLIKINPLQSSIIIQVKFSTQLQPIRSLIGILWRSGDVHPLLSREILRLVCMYVFVCIPILVTTFPEWLSGTEPLPHTPGAVRPSSFVVFCVHVYSFAGLIRRTPPPAFSDTAITDRHFDTTIFQLRANWVRISWSIGSEKSFGHVPPVGVEPSTSCMQGEHPIH